MRPLLVRRSAALVAGGAVALAGCSSGEDEGYGEVPSRPSTTASSGSPSTSAPASPTPAPRSTTVPALAVEEVAVDGAGGDAGGGGELEGSAG